MNSNFTEIQACEWLILRSLGDREDNTLRLVIEEAKSGSPMNAKAAAAVATISGLESLLVGASPILHAEGCRVFEVSWPTYIAYSVRNESYVVSDKYDQFEGRLLVKYTQSRFLDYVKLGTFADTTYPGSFTHWGVICSEHIIDIVSTNEPEVSLMPYGT